MPHVVRCHINRDAHGDASHQCQQVFSWSKMNKTEIYNKKEQAQLFDDITRTYITYITRTYLNGGSGGSNNLRAALKGVTS